MLVSMCICPHWASLVDSCRKGRLISLDLVVKIELKIVFKIYEIGSRTFIEMLVSMCICAHCMGFACGFI